MTTRVHFEYEFLMPPGHRVSVWRRVRFMTKRAVLGIDADPVEEDMARETLIVLSCRYRPGVKFRLVRMTEEVLDAPEQLIESPGARSAYGRQ